MAIATSPLAATLLTYEQYLTEGHIEGRYSIVDGERIFMAGASFRHQRISLNTNLILRRYEEQTGIGYVLSAPFDVLIRRNPLRVRQPDVLFISHQRVAQAGGIPDVGPLGAAPELVVEIISDSETQRMISAKLADYIVAGVEEAWLLRSETRTVELARLSGGQAESIATYDDTQTLQSLTFPDLMVAVADFFRA